MARDVSALWWVDNNDIPGVTVENTHLLSPTVPATTDYAGDWWVEDGDIPGVTLADTHQV